MNTEEKRKRLAENTRRYRLKNPKTEEQKKAAVLRMKNWRLNNPEKSKLLRKKEKQSEAVIEYRKSQKYKETMRLYRLNNREKINKYKRENYRKNKHFKRIQDKKYYNKKINSDPVFKFKCRIRTRLYQFFKTRGLKKYTSTANLIGINYKDAFLFIEKKFKNGMTWDNYGKWHIDHIIPLASAKNIEDITRLCHYTNLQPLWADENIEKNDKIL
jgi:hypothetical protein